MKTALITIGSTREYIDPVRYISNESSGQQGMALIKSLLKKNYRIVCLHGYLQTKLIISPKIKYVFTPNAKSMLAEAKKNSKVDLAIFNAAVADYGIQNYSKQKIKKKSALNLQLKKNPDILKTICSSKQKPKTTIGFAYETNDVFNNAKKKLKTKKCNYLILNFPVDSDPIFNSKYNNGGILNIKGDYIEIGKKTKTSFANQIIAHILK